MTRFSITVKHRQVMTKHAHGFWNLSARKSEGKHTQIGCGVHQDIVGPMMRAALCSAEDVALVVVAGVLSSAVRFSATEFYLGQDGTMVQIEILGVDGLCPIVTHFL
jgi:hypothetical protein